MRSFRAETIRKWFQSAGSATVSFNLVPYTLKLANFIGSSPIPNRQTLPDSGAAGLTRDDYISDHPMTDRAKRMRRIAFRVFFRYSVLAGEARHGGRWNGKRLSRPRGRGAASRVVRSSP